ncbi:hypothetical protein MMC30_009117 [Trapelia coarctata]|nr:hypothetical protein [Trapelia coarctata]
MDSSLKPALAPPPGVMSDFNAANPTYQWNIVCQAVCIPLSTLLVGARMYTRIHVIRKVGWEDYVCCVAWLGLVIYSTLCSIVGKNGGGTHQWNLSQEQYQIFLKLSNVEQALYNVVIMITKISIILLYFAVFAVSRRSLTYAILQVTLWLVVFFNIAVTLVKIFSCSPVRKIWTPPLPGHCLNLAAIFYSTGIFNLVTDVVLLVLPFEFTWRLKIDLKRKLGIYSVFALGSLAPIATALRLAKTVEASSNPDVSYWQYEILLWTMAEITTGIICSCLPTLPALFRHCVPKVESLVSGRNDRDFRASHKHRILISNRRKPSSGPFDSTDNAFLKAGYIGLDEPLNLGVTTDIRGESGFERAQRSLELIEADKDRPHDPEVGNHPAGNGIIKTIHMEQSG